MVSDILRDYIVPRSVTVCERVNKPRGHTACVQCTGAADDKSHCLEWTVWQTDRQTDTQTRSFFQCPADSTALLTVRL